MPFNTPDYQAIRDAILRDIANQNPEANVSSDGDYAIRANATAAAVEGLYQHQQWVLRQLFPDTSDSDILERHCSLHDLARKAATVASGTIIFGGTPGSDVPIGTEAKNLAGIAYLATASDDVGAGSTVTLAAQSSVVGTAGNQAAGSALTLSAAPAGVLSSATIASMSGGTDVETDASLLSRLLFVLRNPPCGGTAHDYYSWAMSVDGVTAAYVYSNRRGYGTTDVLILTTGGIPEETLISSVQAYIETQRPVQADFLALAPIAVPVNVAAALTLAAGYTLAAVGAAIDTALAAYFATLKPGSPVYLHRIRAIISGTAGVVDYTLTAPTANTIALVDATHIELATLGTTAWS